MNAHAEALYGLSVGARWLYLRSDGTPRWKEISACEDVEIREPDTGELHVVRAYVRQNFSTRRLASVHYLTTDATGVHRVRRDDGRPLGSSREVYTPPLLRLRGVTNWVSNTSSVNTLRGGNMCGRAMFAVRGGVSDAVCGRPDLLPDRRRTRLSAATNSASIHGTTRGIALAVVPCVQSLRISAPTASVSPKTT